MSIREALDFAEQYARGYEFDSDEGCYTLNDIERMLLLDMINGLFSEEGFEAALLYTHPSPIKPVAVKALEWVKFSEGLYTAKSVFGVYAVTDGHIEARLNGKTLSRADGLEHGQQICQADFDQRIRSALQAKP